MKAWSASTEREVRKYEEWIEELLNEVRRLHRQRDRRRTNLLDPTDQPKLVVDDFAEFQEITCEICARDHKATIGPELFVASGGDSRVVCWACGMELAPESAAKVFAQRSDYIEQEALNFLAGAASWLSEHVATLGTNDRAAFFEERCELLRDELRRLKGEGYADPATWTGSG